MIAKIIIPYFGVLPWWINFFILSASRNKNMSWTIFTDSATDGVLEAPNVKIKKTSFHHYKKLISNALNITFDPEKPVKLCDLKPFLGTIHPDEVLGFKYWGFGDIDVIYGNISKYIGEISSYWNVISFHDERLSGHLAFFKNRPNVSRIPFYHPDWKNHLQAKEYVGFDEYYLSGFLSNRFFSFSRGQRFTNFMQPPWLVRLLRKIRFKEEYTTPLTGRKWRDGSTLDEQPAEWKWSDGTVFACREKIPTPYLHLMDYKQSQWNSIRAAPWKDESKLLKFTATLDTNEFYISRSGISASPP